MADPNPRQALGKRVMSNYFKGKCTPPVNAKLFQMGFLGTSRTETLNRFLAAILIQKRMQNRKSKSAKSLDISTDFETPNKQGTQPLTESLLSFVESLAALSTIK